MEIPTFLTRLINTFIRNRKFAVHVNNSISDQINIPAGLAQGTCLSPILYALFVADIPKSNKTKIALYADDTAIYTAAKQSNTIVRQLNESLFTLHLYFRKWKIKVNPTKTQATIFTFNNQQRRIPAIPIINNNIVIGLSPSINYLGINFDKKLYFKTHINNTIYKANRCYRMLYPLLCSKSRLTTTNKMLIYTAVIRPIILYGAPIWASAAQTHINKLNLLQNKIIKTIHKLSLRTPTFLLE